mmetsp:Transcript_8828/g.40149  ORF Transcript_8828/g.40149 Transcript_8828/m.40149 type:complete len:220 (+) Transcript_8828:1036-1695(+)
MTSSLPPPANAAAQLFRPSALAAKYTGSATPALTTSMPCTTPCNSRSASMTSFISRTSSSTNVAPSLCAAARAGDMSSGSVSVPIHPAVAATTGTFMRLATASSAVESTPPENSTPSGRVGEHSWWVTTWWTAATSPRASRSAAASMPSSHSGSSPTVRTPSFGHRSSSPVSNLGPWVPSRASVPLVQGSMLFGMRGRLWTVDVGSIAPVGLIVKMCLG